MTWKEYLRIVVDEFANELLPSARLKELANNNAIVGAYAEAKVRGAVRRAVMPLRVSTGAVVSPELCSNPKEVPQIDTIIWRPMPFPALFEAENFGLIPSASSCGIMEIKNSAYNATVGAAIEKVITAADRMVAPVPVVDNHGSPIPTGLGVVCVLKKGQTIDKELASLIVAGKAVVLVKEEEDGGFRPDPRAISVLFNFLQGTLRRAGFTATVIDIGTCGSG